MGNVKRIYVEKKDDYAVKGRELQEDIAFCKEALGFYESDTDYRET